MMKKQLAHFDPKKIPKEPLPTDPSSTAMRTVPTWCSQGMEVDNSQLDLSRATETTEDISDTHHMEEEPESIDIGDLDILGLEQACKTKNYDKILERQLENLEVILSRAQRQKSLGIQTGGLWDGKSIIKDNKKRGRKTDLQCTIRIGEMLVESRRYSKLTKYYNSLSTLTS